MSDNKKTNDSVDCFSAYIRQRLKTHPTEPDNTCWHEIEARLQHKQHTSPLWRGLLVAASLLVAVFIANYIFTKKETTRVNTITDNNLHPEVPGENIPQKTITENEEITGNKETIQKKSSTLHLTAAKTVTIQEDKDLIQEETVVAEEEETLLTESKRKPDADNREEEKKKESKSNLQPIEQYTAYSMPPKHRSGKSNNWQVSAGFRSGGKLSSFLSRSNSLPSDIYYGSHPLPNDNISNEAEGINKPGNEQLEGEKNTEIKHAVPFSVGLTVRKKLNKTWGIESGLVYTYLSSEFKTENRNHYNATQQLYYLGLPVNMVANIWENQRWNVYASGGGMIEKGLRSVYKRQQYINNTPFNRKEERNISGVQWSLNGAVGISYDLYKDINLYLEPGISYYFDYNQPPSKRTEDPTSFNIRIGIRYDFK